MYQKVHWEKKYKVIRLNRSNDYYLSHGICGVFCCCLAFVFPNREQMYCQMTTLMSVSTKCSKYNQGKLYNTIKPQRKMKDCFISNFSTNKEQWELLSPKKFSHARF